MAKKKCSGSGYILQLHPKDLAKGLNKSHHSLIWVSRKMKWDLTRRVENRQCGLGIIYRDIFELPHRQIKWWDL